MRASRCVVACATLPDYRALEALFEVTELAIETSNQLRLERGLKPVQLEVRLPSQTC